jgi:hypothetical protein
MVAGDDKVCDEGYCQGFTTITCEGRGERAAKRRAQIRRSAH